MFANRCYENQVVKNDLVVTYHTEPVSYTDSGTSGTYYKVIRRAEKKYSYVDMTYAGAKNAADDLVVLYTRQEAHLRSRASGQTVPSVVTYGNLRSKIEVSRVEGDIWTVTVDVKEEDERASASLPSDPSSLFTAENLRDYDDLSPVAISINSTDLDATFNRILIRTSNSMTDDQRSATVAMFRASSSASTWDQVSALTWINDKDVLVERTGIVTGSTQVMLQYGGTLSNIHTITASAPYVRIQSAQCYSDASGGSILVNVDDDDFSILPDMDVYLGTSVGTLAKYTGAKTGMSWASGLCTISNGAPILASMVAANRIMLLDSSHSSDVANVAKVQPTLVLRNVRTLGEDMMYCVMVSGLNDTMRDALLAATSITLCVSNDGETFDEVDIDDCTIYVSSETETEYIYITPDDDETAAMRRIYTRANAYRYIKIKVAGYTSSVCDRQA